MLCFWNWRTSARLCFWFMSLSELEGMYVLVSNGNCRPRSDLYLWDWVHFLQRWKQKIGTWKYVLCYKGSSEPGHAWLSQSFNIYEYLLKCYKCLIVKLKWRFSGVLEHLSCNPYLGRCSVEKEDPNLWVQVSHLCNFVKPIQSPSEHAVIYSRPGLAFSSWVCFLPLHI